jgi:hypothetical protein
MAVLCAVLLALAVGAAQGGALHSSIEARATARRLDFMDAPDGMGRQK